MPYLGWYEGNYKHVGYGKYEAQITVGGETLTMSLADIVAMGFLRKD